MCAPAGMWFLDATISGSSRQIADGKGVFMVGGDQGAFYACRSILGILSKKVFYMGASGSGSRAKLASNLILGLNRLALAEGLVFAEKLGLDAETFLNLLKQTPAYSAAMDTKGQKMIEGDFTAESRIRQHHKDVSLILKYAKKTHQQLPLSQVHLDILKKSIASGDGDMDNAAVICELRRRSDGG
jgi:3-hydroxyisobutyrate dehydrogenase-like beta-hydroxyacid dehydrogenase